MTHAAGARGQSKSLVLTAMIFAVAMTFIDQTIVSIAAPTVQHDLGLSSSGMQWAINAYLLSLARHRKGVLATFERGLRTLASGDVENALEIVRTR